MTVFGIAADGQKNGIPMAGAPAPKRTFDRSYSTAINDRAVARLKVTVPDDFGTTLPTMNVLAIKNKVRNSPPLSP